MYIIIWNYLFNIVCSLFDCKVLLKCFIRWGIIQPYHGPAMVRGSDASPYTKQFKEMKFLMKLAYVCLYAPYFFVFSVFRIFILNYRNCEKCDLVIVECFLGLPIEIRAKFPSYESLVNCGTKSFFDISVFALPIHLRFFVLFGHG